MKAASDCFGAAQNARYDSQIACSEFLGALFEVAQRMRAAKADVIWLAEEERGRERYSAAARFEPHTLTASTSSKFTTCLLHLLTILHYWQNLTLAYA